MAIRLPDVLELSDSDPHEDCRFCGASGAADPDEMDGWAAHLAAWHGFQVVEDTPPDSAGNPRRIRLRQIGWTPRAKFAANQRVDVKKDSKPRDYCGRRGTVVGHDPEHSDYAVAFDEYPTLGVLRAETLEPYVLSRGSIE